MDFEKIDNLCCELSKCLNNLDDIADGLEEQGIDATELNKIADKLLSFSNKIENMIEEDDRDDIPDFFGIKRQEELDAKRRELDNGAF